MVTSQRRRVDDRYDLRTPLGRGGMGVVWLAEDTVLQRNVAVKEVEFPPGVPPEEIESLRERVLREARAAGRLNHPNVTTIFDVVRDEGTTWIVMEYVDAPTLTDYVSTEGPLSPPRAAQVGLGVLSALEAAHAAGIVHRDVKPGNVMVPSVGHVKLADFGVAVVQGDSKLTLTGLIIGSPSYMAPEQAQEGVSTAASDMWGLGATLYYAVEGEAPFDRGAAIPTLTAVTYDPPREMQRAGALGPIIERLLAKDPADRPTAGELQAVLREVIADGAEEPAPRTVVLDAAPAPTVPVTQSAAAAPVEEPVVEDDWDDRSPAYAQQRRSGWPWVLVAGLLLLVAAVVFLPGMLADDPAQEVADQEPVEQGDQAAGGDAQPDDAAADAQEDTAADDDAAAEVDPAAEDDAAADDAVDPDEPAAGGATVPDDWSSFSVADTGTTVAHPADWTAQQRSATATDLNDPAGGRYLRVDYTDSPRDDAVADWQRQSESFAQKHQGYEEIAIEPFDYPGAETAALWEYSYTDGGAQLHAYNLAIVIGGRGYALNFQTRENQWEDSQELWEQFVAGFEPAT